MRDRTAQLPPQTAWHSKAYREPEAGCDLLSARGHEAGHRRRELDALATPRSSVLPFLPTLFTALAIASVSLLCTEPSTPPLDPAELPAIVAAEMAQVVHYGPPEPVTGDVSGVNVPAAIAFANAYPMIPEAPPDELTATAGKSQPARIARNVRRACTGARCSEPQRAASDTSRNVDVTPSVPRRTSPFRIEPPAADGLPAGALPFVPTADAIIETVRSLGGKTASLRGPVFETLSWC